MQEMPEEGEIVICNVTKVLPHAVFAQLEEYDKSGMIHISEIAPGRIRNIRDYVKEGKVVVCKILKVDMVKGHIDLSLRRVTDVQRRQKISRVKQEQKAEKIIEFVAQSMKKDPQKLREQLYSVLLKKYGSLYDAFEDVVAGNLKLSELNMEEKTTKLLEEAIHQRIKIPDVEIKGVISLTSYQPNGIELVKEALSKIESMSPHYLGAGKYLVAVKAPDYKHAEKELDENLKKVKSFMVKNDGFFDFKRKEE